MKIKKGETLYKYYLGLSIKEQGIFCERLGFPPIDEDPEY